MSRRRAAAPVEYGESWWCLTCGDRDQDERPKANMLAHLREVHGLTGPVKGTRCMVLHLDMEGRYLSNYEWRFGEVRAMQSLGGPR